MYSCKRGGMKWHYFTKFIIYDFSWEALMCELKDIFLVLSAASFMPVADVIPLFY